MKIKSVQWAVVMSWAIEILLLLIVWFISGYNKLVFALLGVIIFYALYALTSVFSYQIFEFSERFMKDDEKLIELEKDHYGLLFVLLVGTGLAFLIPGLPDLNKNFILIIVGLITLLLSNIVYYGGYLPRYAFLVRKRKIELDIKKVRR